MSADSTPYSSILDSESGFTTPGTTDLESTTAAYDDGRSSDSTGRRKFVTATYFVESSADSCCCVRCCSRWWKDAVYLQQTWRHHVVAASMLVPIILEYLVLLNVYNANIFDATDMADEVEYALMDLFVLSTIGLVAFFFKIEPNFLEVLGGVAGFCAHFSWAFHSPFDAWRIGTPSENDIRHRTEYYDTHAIVFAIYLVLFIRRFPLPQIAAIPNPTP